MNTSLRQNGIISFFLVLVMIAGCDKPPEKKDKEHLPFFIRGKLENKTAGRVFLAQLRGEEFVIRDTASVNVDGSFEFTGNIAEADIYRISLTPENGMLLVIDTHQIEVHADAKDLEKTYEVSGSAESKLIQRLMNIMERNQRQVSDLEKRFIAARQAGQSDSLVYFQEKFLAVKSENAAQIKRFIRKHRDSFVGSYAAFSLIDREEDAEFLDSMLMVFDKNIPDSKFVKLLSEQGASINSLSVGSFAPDITLPQPDGTLLTLSSLRGKYVLLDFWASWCRPCREENPNVVKLYHRYQNKRFQILGISLDQSRDQWVGAIEKDRLPWRHVSDLKGINSVAVQLYKVQAIPLTILLDKEGKIIALNLRGAALEKKLAHLFP
jgi:peroxiredoxin